MITGPSCPELAVIVIAWRLPAFAPEDEEEPHPSVIATARRAISETIETVPRRLPRNTKDKMKVEDSHAAMRASREEIEEVLFPVAEVVIVSIEKPLPPWTTSG